MKELWLAAHEELVNELMDEEGLSWEEAYERASESATSRMIDRLADKADYLRQLRKEGL